MRGLLLTTALVLSTSAAFAQATSDGDVTGANATLGTQIGVQDNDVTNNYSGSDLDTVVHGTQSTTNVTNQAIQPNGYVSNPNLTTGGSDVCLGSSSGGISAAGIGISGGSTTVDENCVMLKNAKILASLGLKDAAVTLIIISNEKAAEALSLSNPELFNKLMNISQ